MHDTLVRLQCHRRGREKGLQVTTFLVCTGLDGTGLEAKNSVTTICECYNTKDGSCDCKKKCKPENLRGVYITRERNEESGFSTWAEGIANAMGGENEATAAARPASAVCKESGSISSQKSFLSRTRRHDDDACGSKIRSWRPRFVTLSIERFKYQHVYGVPREPPTLLERLERGQRKTSTLRINAGRRCCSTA